MRKIQSGDFSLMQVQTNTEQVINAIREKDVLDGVRVEGVALSTSATQIEHKLDRKPLGWLIVGKNGPGDVWESATRTSKLLTLQADATVTVDLWVF